MAPDNGGSAITRYSIYFRHSDGLTFSEESTQCDGANSVIMSALKCNVAAYLLNEAPFNLPWGTNVHVKISAYNVKGESIHSGVANGATIIAVPDAPILLKENPVLRTSTTLGLVWSPAPDDGSLPVLDYKVSVQS